MTIAVIHRQPSARAWGRGADRSAAQRRRPVARREPRAVRAGARGLAPLRWTARGRAVARVAVAAALAVVLVAVVAGAVLVVHRTALAGTTTGHPAVRYHVVLPGETLWGIAAKEAPAADRRETVARIVELNALDGSRVLAGQRLAIPAG